MGLELFRFSIQTPNTDTLRVRRRTDEDVCVCERVTHKYEGQRTGVSS